MAFRRRPAAGDYLSSDDETEDRNRSISQLVSKLRNSFRSSDFNRVEEALVVREARLKREHEKQRRELEEKLESERVERLRVGDEVKIWKDKYEKLLEKAKRWGVDADQELISELRSKNKKLQSENMKLLRGMDSQMSRLEDQTAKFMKDLGINIEPTSDINNGEVKEDGGNNRNENSAPVGDSENVFGSVKATEGNRDPQKSAGIRFAF